ncbi:phosphorylase [Methanolobus psychrophilus R15]|nr:phosphorylase [Methanolobus psychrophilus R15]
MDFEDKYEFRALFLKKEFDEVKDLLVNEPTFKNYYPDFEKWLEKALKEALKGERLVYALYEAALRLGKPQLKINSVAIVKIAGESAELKCLFIDEIMDSNGSGKLLYERVEEQLTKKGIGKIITDVPYENKELNWFLIQNGFQVNGFVERYKKGRFDYILSKDVPMCYTGDPFNWYSISKWFLENVYGFKIADCEEKDEEFIQEHRLLVTSKNDTNLMLPYIKGNSIVYDGMLQNDKLNHIIEAINTTNSFNIIIAHEFEDENLDSHSQKNILCFDKKSVFEKCGCDEPLFEKEDINGIIVEVKKERFEKIPLDDSHFTYVKGSGSGRFARINNYVLFLVDSHGDSPFGAIMGYGKIKKISCSDPISQWEAHKDLNPIFSKDDYDQFTAHKKEVIAIVVEGFKEIEPILYNDFKVEFKEHFQGDYIGNVYVNEDFTTSFLLYLSQKQDLLQGISEIEEDDSEEGQLKLLLEKVNAVLEDFKRQNTDFTMMKKDIEEIRIKQQPSIKEEIVISVGLEALGTGGQHIVTIPIQDIPYKDLKEELEGFFSAESSGKYPQKIVNRILKSLLEKKLSQEDKSD